MAPIGNLFSELEDGPVETLRQPSPQAVHHFTQADQVNQLVGAVLVEGDWLWRLAKLNGILYLPDVGSKTIILLCLLVFSLQTFETWSRF